MIVQRSRYSDRRPIVDADITFGSGLTISWSGKPLGTLKMPVVSLAADEGAQLDLSADFSVADVDHLTEFTKAMVTSESFQWDISGENLTVSALGNSHQVMPFNRDSFLTIIIKESMCLI